MKDKIKYSYQMLNPNVLIANLPIILIIDLNIVKWQKMTDYWFCYIISQ
jgi:hypothetical protein